MKITFNLNGSSAEAEISPSLSLADMLRSQFKIYSIHLGCEQGVCGACTVLLDGKSVRSCLMLAVQADAHDIVTAEGVALLEGENWENIESTLVQSGAFQCGFCTSGMVVSLEEILANKALVTRSDILSRLSGQVCRCTGYEPILLAFETLLDAAHLLRKEQL